MNMKIRPRGGSSPPKRRRTAAKITAVICMLGLLAALFGCSKTPSYPFDVQKAYCFSRRGIIAGGNFSITLEPQGIVEYHSYPKSASRQEGGMKDKGADIFFTGLKEGTVQVTVVYTYPTSPPDEYTFTLRVAEDLSVTKQN